FVGAAFSGGPVSPTMPPQICPCPRAYNSFNKNAASISSLAPTAVSSSPSKPHLSKTPTQNSSPPATPLLPTPSSSSKPKPKSISPYYINRADRVKSDFASYRDL